jgi:hypothetical protein
VSRRYTSGFDILGMDRDPTPGDPDRIDELARFYEEIRDDAQTGVRVLGRGGSLSRARGESMEKLRDMLDNLPRKLQQTVVSFDAAAQAYRTYARVLRDQQTRIDTAMDQATEVVAAARRAPKPAPAGATPEQITEARVDADDIAGARARLSAARQLAADARRLREAASARCNRDLDDAADKAIKPPPRRNFFQRIGDFFRNNPIFRLIIDIVIAVVGVVLPVVGIVLAAVALVVTVAVQAANGNFELGTLLVGLVTLVPGAKLIGPLVRGAKSVAPGLVKTVSSGAQAFGKIGRNNTVITGALQFSGRAPALGKQVLADFGKGVVEEVATVGLNKLGNPNSDGFNAASIFGGAAAGAAAGGLFEAGADSFRKNSGDVDLDFRKGDSPGPSSTGGDSIRTSGPADVGSNGSVDVGNSEPADVGGKGSVDGGGNGSADVGNSEPVDVGPSTGDRLTDGADPTGESGQPTDGTDAPGRQGPADPPPAGDGTDPEPMGPAPVNAPPPTSAPASSASPTPPVTSKPDTGGVPPEASTPAAGSETGQAGPDSEPRPAVPQQPPADPDPGASATADVVAPRPSTESPAASEVPAPDQTSAAPSAPVDPAPQTPAGTSKPEASGQVPPQDANSGAGTASERGGEDVDPNRPARADGDGAAPSGDGGPPVDGTDTGPVDPQPAGGDAAPEPSTPAPIGGPSPTGPAAGGSPTSAAPSKPGAGGETPDDPVPVGGAETGRAGRDAEPEPAVSERAPTATDPSPKDSAPAESAGLPEPEAANQVPQKNADGEAGPVSDGGGESVDQDQPTRVDGEPSGPDEVVDADAVPVRDSTPPANDDSGSPEPVEPEPSVVPAAGGTPDPGTEGSTTAPDAAQQQPGAATATTDEPASADAEIDQGEAIEERTVEEAKAIVSDEASQAASEAIEERQGKESEDESGEGQLKFSFLLDEDLSQSTSTAGDDTGFTKRFRR